MSSAQTPVAQKLAILALALALVGTVTFRLTFGNRTQAYLDNPKAGDIYMVRMDDGKSAPSHTPLYTLVQVDSVHTDRVIAHAAQERSASKRRIYRALARAVAEGVPLPAGRSVAYPRASLLALHTKGVILVAKRGNS